MLIGNPDQPALQTRSILNTKPSWWSIRTQYLDDWVYKQRFQPEFRRSDTSHTRTFVKLSTYAGLLTLNFIDRIDLYGLAGSSRMQIDKEVFTKRALCWGVGTKCLLFKWKDLSIGADLKYFETNQKPKYFVVEDLPYNIVSDFRLHYHEIQAAIGASYQIYMLSPYINLTYQQTKIAPTPSKVYIRFPDANEEGELNLESVINQKPWGMALGLSFVDNSRATLSFEWRLFNQNAIDWNFEIRF